MIRTCICGSPESSPFLRGIPQLEVRRCDRCGTERLAGEILEDGVLESYTSGAYHQSTTRHANVIPYTERFEHDKHIGSLRLARYRQVIGSFEGMKLLDVGAGNGGFVAAAASYCDAKGIDADPQDASTRGWIARGTIADVEGFYDIITYHDVLEHVYNPHMELEAAVARLGVNGYLIVDVPDVYVPSGQHHYKLEHVWYFSLRGLVDMLRAHGLDIIGVDYPIAGKLVVYGQRIR